MSAKAGFCCGLFLTVLSAYTARAGDEPTPPAGASDPTKMESLPAPTPAGNGSGATTPTESETLPGEMLENPQEQAGSPAPNPSDSAAPIKELGIPTLSNWMTYSRPDCCGPIGGNGPITYELFARSGPVFTHGDGILGKLLDHEAGWNVEAGGRTLFFNPGMDAAWTVDLSLDYMYNHSRPDPKVPLVIAVPPQAGNFNPPFILPSTLQNVHRTMANFGGGREWWLNSPANANGFKWRAGFDAGGRLGTAKANFVEVQHRTDTIYGAFTALHADVEKSCGCCCTFMAGFRAEWDFTWMDVLKDPNNSNVQDVNLMVTFGVRF